MFDRSAIMKTAWHYHRRFNHSMQTALSRAWREAKMAMKRYTVIGESFGRADEVIAEGVTFERAGELEWFNKCRFDRITIKVA